MVIGSKSIFIGSRRYCRCMNHTGCAAHTCMQRLHHGCRGRWPRRVGRPKFSETFQFSTRFSANKMAGSPVVLLPLLASASTLCLALAVDCPAGKFLSPFDGCVRCNSGKFSLGCTNCVSTSSCPQCPLGQYQPGDESSGCLLCESGRWADSLGTVQCNKVFGDMDQTCPAGKGGPLGSTSRAAATCADCQQGKFSSQPGTGNCPACVPGQYGDAPAAQTCQACAPGQFQASSGQTTCSGVPCALGTYGAVGQLSATPSCASCASGTYADETGKSSCKGNGCNVDTYGPLAQSSEIAATCTSCSAGTFTDSQIGRAACDPIPVETPEQRQAWKDVLDGLGKDALLPCEDPNDYDKCRNNACECAVGSCRFRPNVCDGVSAKGKKLVRVDFHESNVPGTLSAAIGNLTDVTMINIRYTRMSGTLPASITGLSKLETLRFGNPLGTDPTLSGTIPADIGRLTRLKTLIFGRVDVPSTKLTYNRPASQLSGTLPGSIDDLASLEELKIVGARVSGTLPFMGSLRMLTALTLVDLQGLRPPLPPLISWGNLTRLRQIDIAGSPLGLGSTFENVTVGTPPCKVTTVTACDFLPCFGDSYSTSCHFGSGSPPPRYCFTNYVDTGDGGIVRQQGTYGICTNTEYECRNAPTECEKLPSLSPPGGLNRRRQRRRRRATVTNCVPPKASDCAPGNCPDPAARTRDVQCNGCLPGFEPDSVTKQCKCTASDGTECKLRELNATLTFNVNVKQPDVAILNVISMLDNINLLPVADPARDRWREYVIVQALPEIIRMLGDAGFLERREAIADLLDAVTSMPLELTDKAVNTAATLGFGVVNISLALGNTSLSQNASKSVVRVFSSLLDTNASSAALAAQALGDYGDSSSGDGTDDGPLRTLTQLALNGLRCVQSRNETLVASVIRTRNIALAGHDAAAIANGKKVVLYNNNDNGKAAAAIGGDLTDVLGAPSDVRLGKGLGTASRVDTTQYAASRNPRARTGGSDVVSIRVKASGSSSCDLSATAAAAAAEQGSSSPAVEVSIGFTIKPSSSQQSKTARRRLTASGANNGSTPVPESSDCMQPCARWNRKRRKFDPTGCRWQGATRDPTTKAIRAECVCSDDPNTDSSTPSSSASAMSNIAGGLQSGEGECFALVDYTFEQLSRLFSEPLELRFAAIPLVFVFVPLGLFLVLLVVDQVNEWRQRRDLRARMDHAAGTVQWRHDDAAQEGGVEMTSAQREAISAAVAEMGDDGGDGGGSGTNPRHRRRTSSRTWSGYGLQQIFRMHRGHSFGSTSSFDGNGSRSDLRTLSLSSNSTTGNAGDRKSQKQLREDGKKNRKTPVAWNHYWWDAMKESHELLAVFLSLSRPGMRRLHRAAILLTYYAGHMFMVSILFHYLSCFSSMDVIRKGTDYLTGTWWRNIVVLFLLEQALTLPTEIAQDWAFWRNHSRLRKIHRGGGTCCAPCCKRQIPRWFAAVPWTLFTLQVLPETLFVLYVTAAGQLDDRSAANQVGLFFWVCACVVAYQGGSSDAVSVI